MVPRATTHLASLYHQDETAWLEEMARLVADQRVAELDLENLGEFLSDMARRDRREVYSRLVTLLTHLLKWQYQPERRTSSWRGAIRSQRLELRLLLESGTLRNHAAAILPEVYQEAPQAADETELPIATFPVECRQSVDELIAPEEQGHG